jgi:murein DD-endopeptidase MepM/ murein hydrolase activator NlpD
MFNKIRGGTPHNAFGHVRTDSRGHDRVHQGWDLEARIGTPVYAVADGRVVFTANSGPYGRQVCISFVHDGMPLYAFYAHLKDVFVVGGEKVSPWTVLGTTGNTGNARRLRPSEYHLHFEIRTSPMLGLGLTGRMDPAFIYGFVPLKAAIPRRSIRFDEAGVLV